MYYVSLVSNACVFLMTSFLFLSFNETPIIYHCSLVSALSKYPSFLLDTVQASAPYISTDGLIVVFYTFPLRWFSILAPHNTPGTRQNRLAQNSSIKIATTLAQDPYVAARVGFGPTTLRLKGIASTNAPPHPNAACLCISTIDLIASIIARSAGWPVFHGHCCFSIEYLQPSSGGYLNTPPSDTTTLYFSLAFL